MDDKTYVTVNKAPELMSIQQSLRDYESALYGAPRRVVGEGQKWASDVPQEAGVYVLWKDESPIYVGETSSLRSRMRDLTRFENHTFARLTCKQFGITKVDKAGLVDFFSKTYKLSFILVPFGRKEVEEFLILRWRSSLFNKPTTRLMKGTQYDWVSAIPSPEQQVGKDHGQKAAATHAQYSRTAEVDQMSVG